MLFARGQGISCLRCACLRKYITRAINVHEHAAHRARPAQTTAIDGVLRLTSLQIPESRRLRKQIVPLRQAGCASRGRLVIFDRAG